MQFSNPNILISAVGYDIIDLELSFIFLFTVFKVSSNVTTVACRHEHMSLLSQ